MARFKSEKGLTLIELLITISVLAIVSAIALPVINNVVSSSNSNAAVQTQSDVNDFIAKYNAAGEVLLSTDGRTLQGFIDTDGDNTIDANELVDTLTIDSKFSFSAAGASDSVGGSYTSKGITGVTVGLASAGGSTNAPANSLVVTSVGSRSFVSVYATSPNWSAEYPYLYMNANEYWFWTEARFMEFAASGAMTANADGSVNFNDWGTGTVTKYDANPLVTPGANIVPITLPNYGGTTGPGTETGTGSGTDSGTGEGTGTGGEGTGTGGEGTGTGGEGTGTGGEGTGSTAPPSEG